MDALIDVAPEPKCASAIGIISRWRVESGERVAKWASERGGSEANPTKNGSKCFQHYLRPLVDPNRV